MLSILQPESLLTDSPTHVVGPSLFQTSSQASQTPFIEFILHPKQPDAMWDFHSMVSVTSFLGVTRPFCDNLTVLTELQFSGAKICGYII